MAHLPPIDLTGAAAATAAASVNALAAVASAASAAALAAGPVALPAGHELDAAAVEEALKQVSYPGLSRDLVSFGMVGHVSVCDNRVKVQLAIRAPAADAMAVLDADIRERLGALGATSVSIEVVKPEPAAPQPHAPRTAPDPWADQVRLSAVKHVIAVGAGKGGVGKSTVAVNVAIALAREGLRTALLDADIYGPSLPILLGVEDGASKVRMSPEKHIMPLEAHGIPFISFGFFLGEGSPAIWRGPMVAKTVRQFTRGDAWPELDILIVDLPPGTGDVPLSLAQSIQLSGAVVVTQPARVAAAEARKAVEMFASLEVPVLGIVENMTGAFGAGAAQNVSGATHAPILGSVPFDTYMVGEGDLGTPTVLSRPYSDAARAFDAIAAEVAGALGWQKVDPAA